MEYLLGSLNVHDALFVILYFLSLTFLDTVFIFQVLAHSTSVDEGVPMKAG